MQPIKRLSKILADLAGPEHYLFTLSDLRAVLPDLSSAAFKVLVSRAARSGLLRRVCRGVYLYDRVTYPPGEVLFHAAARLRADCFSYISLETALSDAGVISQVPINTITLMSSGRGGIIRCGTWGTIEYVHTRKRPEVLQHQLQYDRRCHNWRASVRQALADMRDTRRSLDLVDWSVADEFV
jgi:hypothetical protein